LKPLIESRRVLFLWLSILLCGSLWPKKTYLPNADGRYIPPGGIMNSLNKALAHRGPRRSQKLKVLIESRRVLCGQKKLPGKRRDGEPGLTPANAFPPCRQKIVEIKVNDAN
jgi:hypothetical protein